MDGDKGIEAEGDDLRTIEKVVTENGEIIINGLKCRLQTTRDPVTGKLMSGDQMVEG